MGTPITRAPRARKASSAPRKLGCSTSTVSPAATKTLAARSMPCWQPLVTHTVLAIDVQAALLQQIGDGGAQRGIAWRGADLQGAGALFREHVGQRLAQGSTGASSSAATLAANDTSARVAGQAQQVALRGRPRSGAAGWRKRRQGAAGLERRQRVFLGAQWRRGDECARGRSRRADSPRRPGACRRPPRSRASRRAGGQPAHGRQALARAERARLDPPPQLVHHLLPERIPPPRRAIERSARSRSRRRVPVARLYGLEAAISSTLAATTEPHPHRCARSRVEIEANQKFFFKRAARARDGTCCSLGDRPFATALLFAGDRSFATALLFAGDRPFATALLFAGDRPFATALLFAGDRPFATALLFAVGGPLVRDVNCQFAESRSWLRGMGVRASDDFDTAAARSVNVPMCAATETPRWCKSASRAGGVPASTAMSRPPEVWASARTRRWASVRRSDQSMKCSTEARLRRVPPGTTSLADEVPGVLEHGTASASMRAPTSPRAEHLGQVAEQAEAGHVGGRVDADR